MPAAAIVTLIIVAVLVVALAAYLMKVIQVLGHVNDTLGKVTFGVRAIAHRTEPVGMLVGDMNGDLGAVACALEGLVASVPSSPAATAA